MIPVGFYEKKNYKKKKKEVRRHFGK